MSNIRLTAFTGEQPRLIARLMPENAAQSAHDVRLDDGGLTPIRVFSSEGDLETENVATIYKWLGNWLSWSTVVDATPGPVATHRLYYTGDGAPKMRIEPPEGGLENPTVFDLAVPRPTVKLTAVTNGSPSDVSNPKFTRIYVYTWVTALGEESEPTPASNQVTWQVGQSVVLTGFAVPSTNRFITEQRIYRSQTGTQGTYYYFIAARGVSTLPFEDSVPQDAFSEPLPSLSYNAPIASLRGLISMPGGMMVAFSGKKLYFCEPYKPHAWPEKYALTVDYTIVALGAMGNVVLVLTDGNPYMASGKHPSSMQLQKVEQNLACINARSRVDLGFAIAYASNEGLVLARADGSMGVVSANLFNRDDWLTYSPSTIIGCQVAGRYVGFYRALQADGVTRKTGALIISLPEPVFLAHTDTDAVACHYDLLTSSLYYTPPLSSEVRRLDSPNGLRRRLYWKSKEFILPAPDNFGAFLIESVQHRSDAEQTAFDATVAAIIAQNQAMLALPSIEGDINSVPFNVQEVDGDMLLPVPQDDMVISVGIYADKRLIASVDDTNTAVRLPSGFKARKWEIDISTNMEVFRMAMAKSMDELKVTP